MEIQKLIISEKVLEKARQLEEVALSSLVRQSYPFIFRYFCCRSITRTDAEDLTSEVFVRVVNSIKSQKGHFPAWLFSIARNLLTDYYRRQGRSREAPLEDVEDSFPNSTEDKIDVLQSKLIKKSLNFLTREQREVITLKFLEGYDNEEIADRMNKSVGAIKTLQFRALLALRGFIKNEG